MKLNILLLCNLPPNGKNANTIVDHIMAFQNFSNHKIWVFSMLGTLPKKLELGKFDAIVIHYSLALLWDHYISNKSKQLLREYVGLKIVFIQDEYRRINTMIEQLAFLKIDVLFTCFPEKEMHAIYSEEKLPNLSKYNNLTGYISDYLLQFKTQKKITERTIDVGYRARKLPFWYGKLAFEKWDIVEQWQKHSQDSHLVTDLSYLENARIYGDKWIAFLNNCKTTLGVESGASVMDFTGELEKTIEAHQRKYPQDSFFEIQKKYLLEHEGKYALNQISPRCFEAIALKTVLVLYEGEYSNILIPHQHYIPLKKDFSNIQEVLKTIHDPIYLQNMADRAYEEIALNPEYSYQGFINKFDNIISFEFKQRQKKRTESTYDEVIFNEISKFLPLKNKLYNHALYFYRKLPQHVRSRIRAILRACSIY